MTQTTPSARTSRRSSSKTPRTAQNSAAVTAMLDPERRRSLIAEAAYFRAERRGFTPGCEAADWLAAEAEVDTALTMGVQPSSN
jgi:hypothetical protein